MLEFGKKGAKIAGFLMIDFVPYTVTGRFVTT